MAEFGTNEQGFVLKRLRDILDDLQAGLITIQDAETGETLQVDFDDDDPLIQVINALAANNATTWESLQAVYNQFNPQLATGAALSGLVQLNALQRRFGNPSTIALALTGDPGILIPQGSQISDTQQLVVYQTDADITLDGTGNAVGTASSVENGAFVSLAGTITEILNPINGWDTVTNTADAAPGNVTETDEELRLRRNRATESPSVAPVEAVFGNLGQLEGVTFARVYVNNTLAVDARGLPGKSIGAVVVGGDDLEIAQTLFLRSPIGLAYFGNTIETVRDVNDEPYVIQWIRPTDVDVAIEIDITVTDENTFPTDGEDRIKEAILAYAANGAAGLSINTGFEELGFVPGEPVSVSRLYTPVNSIPGHRVDRLEIAIVGNAVGLTDIPVDFDEVAAFDSGNITITVAP